MATAMPLMNATRLSLNAIRTQCLGRTSRTASPRMVTARARATASGGIRLDQRDVTILTVTLGVVLGPTFGGVALLAVMTPAVAADFLAQSARSSASPLAGIRGILGDVPWKES
ncbi:MAG TPA: hypothetical protein VMM79_10280 [Longimicrobiales bacterium]|nr:hypothetical protein [Longimicrobiales bacterium]